LSSSSSQIKFLEPIEDSLTKYEEESGTVFLARGCMDRLRRISTSMGSMGGDPRAGLGVGGAERRWGPAQGSRMSRLDRWQRRRV